MAGSVFGSYLKKLRMAKGQTLRDFCLAHGFDPGNYSKLERGILPPPQRTDLLEKYAQALGIVQGSDEWIEVFDLAAAARGEIPHDLLSDEKLLEKLPVLFRTLRGNRVSPDKLDTLINIVRKG